MLEPIIVLAIFVCYEKNHLLTCIFMLHTAVDG